MKVLLTAYAWGVAVAHSVAEDIGFECMFYDYPQQVYPAKCFPAPKLPSYLDGTFIIQSTAKYSMGNRSFGSWLDTFWKIHSLALGNGEVCYKSKFIATGYYNESLARGTVAPGILFLETTPPRDCAAGGMCNLAGANDNNFAVSYRIEDGLHSGKYRYALMTDTEIHLDFDLDTLAVRGKREFKDDFKLPLHIQKGGGTHLHCEAGKGFSAGNCDGHLYGLVFEQGKSNNVDLYRLTQGNPDMRELIAHVGIPWTPGSFHSFGLTEDYAVLPLMPYTIDGVSMMKGSDLLHSIKDTGPITPIFLVNLKDGSIRNFTFESTLYYVHVVNSWQNETHVELDVSAFVNEPFTIDNPAMVLNILRNKTARDISDNVQTIRRLSINLSSGKVTEVYLTSGPGLIDFPMIHPNKRGLPYCIYYGIEWKHNGRDYGSWALRKHNLCTGEVQFFYEANTYLSEGTFIPSPGGTNEDDGVLMLIQTSGLTNGSSLILLDARTLSPVEQVPIPETVGWMGHGAFYP